MSYLTLAFIVALLGAALLIGEYFLGTGGILLIAAILCFCGASGIIGMYGTTLEFVISIVLIAITIPLSTYFAILAWRRIFGGEPSPAAEASIAEMPELAELNQLKGRVGKTVSALRPSGVVEFENRKIDVLTEGLMIDAGVWVKCVDVKPGKVIVRQIDPMEINQPAKISSKANVVSQTSALQEESKPIQQKQDTAKTISQKDSETKTDKKPDLNNDDWQIN